MELSQTEIARPKWLALGAVAVLLGLALRDAWVTEDAYITLRTVDNLVHGHGLRWNLDERVQSYTHPLWMLLLSAGYFVTREAFYTTITLGVLTTAAAALVLVHFARSAGHAVIAVALLALSRGFIDFATSGLENPLSHLLVITFIGLHAMRSAQLWKLALVAALLMCNRTDAILIVAPALLHASWLSLRALGWKPTLRALLVGFSPLIAWELFSLFYYGFPFPNTAYAKLNTGLPRLEVLAQGFVYWANALAWDPVLHVVALAGVAAAWLQRRPRDALIAVGLVSYSLYVINIGGDFMQGRFWTLPFFTGACLLAISELPLADPTRALALVLPFAFLFVHPLAKESFARDYTYAGIADEHAIYRDETSVALSARSRTMPAHAWTTLGRDLRRRGEHVFVHQNVGIVGYFAGPKVHIIDPLALTDPLLARLPMRYKGGWRVGHYERQLPSGYVDTVSDQSGACKMRDKNLCTYYGHLREITAGPLFSFSRLGTLLAMNLGRYDALIDREYYRNPVTRRATLQELSEPVAERAAWDATGTFQITTQGMVITLPAPSHAARIELSLDGNDDYRLEFRAGKRVISKVESAALEAGAMRTRELTIPEPARAEGFDHIAVRPRNGDGLYSIGYVRLHEQ